MLCMTINFSVLLTFLLELRAGIDAHLTSCNLTYAEIISKYFNA
jgi:hypothetical protein